MSAPEKTFPIPSLNLHGELYKTGRLGGRRIVIRDRPGGTQLWDSGDQYDLGNAINAADLWLEQEAKRRAT